MGIFENFERKHDYLVCVDSDGCVMDTMNCKHFHCFGPCMVDEWELDPWREEILTRWNVINLFSMTRGINRFKGLAMALGEIHEKYVLIPGIKALQHWADTAPALSNDAVAKAAEAAEDAEAKLVLEKALRWSKAVNAAIVKLPEELKVPYDGAKEGLAAAHAFADVAMVSSANRDHAVWDYRGMPANFLGQICLPFSLLWIPLSLGAMALYELLDRQLKKHPES